MKFITAWIDRNVRRMVDRKVEVEIKIAIAIEEDRFKYEYGYR